MARYSARSSGSRLRRGLTRESANGVKRTATCTFDRICQATWQRVFTTQKRQVGKASQKRKQDT